MSYWLLAASGLSAATSTFTSIMDRQRQASVLATEYKIAKKAREANNRLLAISSAQSRNVIEENRGLARADTIRASELIQRDALETRGAVTASAAAAGVGGTTVANRLREVGSSAGRVQQERFTGYSREQRTLDAQTSDLLFSTALGKDRTVSIRPSSLGTTLDASISAGLAGITSAYTTFLKGRQATAVGAL